MPQQIKILQSTITITQRLLSSLQMYIVSRAPLKIQYYKKSKNKIATTSSPYRNFNATIGLCMFLWEYYSAFSLYGRFRQAYNAIISPNKGPVYRVYQHKLFEKKRDISAISRL